MNERRVSSKESVKKDNQSHAFIHSGNNKKLDSLDIQIIDELLADADISTAAIASKYALPLSTIQRRRAALESTSVVMHKYTLNPAYFGSRRAEFWIKVEMGKVEQVAQHIFEKYENVFSICQQINSISNLGIVAYVNSSEQLYNMLEEFKSIRFVENVEYAEIVKVTHRRDVNLLNAEEAQLRQQKKPIQ